MKQLLRRLLTFIAVIISVIAVASLVLVIFGFRPFILDSSSMEPLYTRGSLVWVNTRVSSDQVEIGDVVAYRSSSGNLILHRVVGENLLQGDANDQAQEVELSSVNLIGKEAFTIPMLGTLISGVLRFKWLVFVVVAVLIIAACVPETRLPWKKKESGLTAESDKDGEKN